VTVEGNTITGNPEYGILVNDGSDHHVLNNSVEETGKTGISIKASATTVAGNLIHRNVGTGLYVGGTTNNIMDNSIVDNLGGGVNIPGSVLISRRENRFFNNTILNCTLHISKGNIVENNTFNHGKLYYLDSVTGTEKEPVKISDDASTIIIYECAYIEITNNDLSGNDYGIYAEESENIIISGNRVHNNSNGGILLKDSQAILINDNMISDNLEYGVNLPTCDDILIEDNTVARNRDGISIPYFQNSFKILHNIFSENQESGIVCSLNDQSIIAHNSITNNTLYGISIYHIQGPDNSIRENIISKNQVGIFFFEGAMWAYNGDSEIIYNEIYDNTKEGMFFSRDWHVVNVSYNWWGDPSGPYHPLENPGGKGDPISGNASFSPWLKSPDERIASADEDSFPYTALVLILIVVLGAAVSFYKGEDGKEFLEKEKETAVQSDANTQKKGSTRDVQIMSAWRTSHDEGGKSSNATKADEEPSIQKEPNQSTVHKD